MANAVIAAIEPRLAGTQDTADPTPKQKPVHVVVMGVHTVDAPDRAQPHFPASSVDNARRLLQKELESLRDDQHDLVVLASGAPGADILSHEVCRELGIPSTVCLPMPAENFAAETFQTLDDWRSRFLELQQQGLRILELSDRPGLPRWLEGSNTDPWDRGNRWVMQMARTWKAERLSLIALSEESGGGEVGGTEQMVQLARAAGNVDVKLVDSKQLLV